MATRSFLKPADLLTAEALLQSEEPLGLASFFEIVPPLRKRFSSFLEEKLVERLNTLGDLTALEPVLLGSWARHELCPKSDIDLLLLGAESEVREFNAKAFGEGLKLRARSPKDADDWTIGVEPFDILALQSAQTLSESAAVKLDGQRARVRKARTSILRAIRKEREERHRRQDSVSSYLEPNLKFGAGGLRDIEAALSLRELFSEKFEDLNPYPFQVLRLIKEELLFLRGHLHLISGGDILSAADQLELASRLKIESALELMKFVQSELERASFYADWVCAQAQAGTLSRAKAAVPLKTFAEAMELLQSDPSLLNQFNVRLKIDELDLTLKPVERGRALNKAIFSTTGDAQLLALFRTRTLEILIPDIKKLKGLVQHDHYHRYTADAHLVQTLREVQRMQSKPRQLGVLSVLTKDLKDQDWWTLKLTALFHDLAKGRKGHHASEGAKLVKKYFADWQFAETLSADVQWLVENHLILSTAAFRQNPDSQSTWRRLFERGVQGRRLILLTLFTAIDIRATNPDAWTDWKAQLLLSLTRKLQSPEALSLQQHLKYAAREPRATLEERLTQLDPVLLQSLSPRILVEDLRQAALSKVNLTPKILRQHERIWVRFHSKRDETGLFLDYVKRLYGLGLNIQISSVNTLTDVGVYDWFCLRTEKSVAQVSRWLSLKQDLVVKVPTVRFQSVDLMSQDQDEWIFSFRGKDQRGLLLAAAQSLVEQKLSLRWARAHTWGQQIDDIFSVQPSGEVEEALKHLRSRFVT